MSRSFKKLQFQKTTKSQVRVIKHWLIAPFVEEINRHYIRGKPIRNVIILGKFMIMYRSILKNKL